MITIRYDTIAEFNVHAIAARSQKRKYEKELETKTVNEQRQCPALISSAPQVQDTRRQSGTIQNDYENDYD